MAKDFIQDAIKRPGALRKKLKVKEGEDIPEAKLKRAEHSKSPKLREEANLAETLKGLRRKKK